MHKKNFKITTLSANNRLGDIIGIITGGTALLSELFPSIFGGGRKLLTPADWLSLIPGSGYWTVQFREYLKSRIKYDVDFTTWARSFTMDFIWNRKNQICPEVPESCWNYTAANDPNGGFQCIQCLQAFNSILQQEKITGGSSPVGNIPGYSTGGLNWSILLPAGLVLFAIVAAKKNKK